MSQSPPINPLPEPIPRSRHWYNQLITTRLGYSEPRDWQTRLPMEMDSGKDVFLIVATGQGKSTMIHVPILADMAENKASLGLVIVPTKTLADDQARSANAKGIPSLALHEDTLRAAQTNKENLFDYVQTGRYKLVFLGPEMLISPPFDAVLKSTLFRSLIRYIFVDEAHLACEWSIFREPYTRVRLLRPRLGSQIVWVALTATCALGKELESVCDRLGFTAGKYTLEALPVDRPTVKYVPRFLNHPISGSQFLDLCWLASGPIKTPGDIPITIIFAERIELVTRIKRYLWNILPPTLANRRKAVLAYHSIHTSEYRIAAMEALRDGSTTRILVSTDTGAYGLDVSTIRRVIIFGLSSTYHASQQRSGRIRTDGVTFFYSPEWMDINLPRTAKGEAWAAGQRSKVPPVMVDFANPTVDRCSRQVNCEFWGQAYVPPSIRPCLCDTHQPDTSDLDAIKLYIAEHPPQKPQTRTPMPRSRDNHSPLVGENKAQALALLVKWRIRTWRRIPHPPLVPPNELISTAQLEDLVSRLHQCTSYERLGIAMQKWPLFDEFGAGLWIVCSGIWDSIGSVDTEMSTA